MHKSYFFVFVLALCSCHVGEDIKLNQFISNQKTQETLNLSNKKEHISHTWYEIFKDQDLNTLLNKAMNSNISIAESIERLKQSRYAFSINNVNSLPMLNANANYNYSKTNNRLDVYNNIDAFKVGFDASWEIDLWGKNKYISDQYYELMKKAEYSLHDIKVTISAEIINNYINLRKSQEKLRIAKKNLTLQNDIFSSVSEKYKVGIADDLTFNQAMFTIEKTKASIPPLKQEIEKYKNAIAILIGCIPQETPIDLDKFSKNITSKTFKYSVKTLYNLPLDIIKTRPDIRATEQSVYTQNAILNQAIADLYPNLSIAGSFGFISQNTSSLFETRKQSYGYNPEFIIPIWQWGKLKNNVELQKHIKDEYILNYNEAMLTALVELKNAIYFVEEAYKTNKFTLSALNKMRNILILTKNKYENGLIEFTDLAQAEQDFLSAQNAYIESNAEILQNIASFYKATGGGYNFKQY